MPGVKCKCGNILKTGGVPNPIEWLMISDNEYDKYINEIDAEELYSTMKSMLICDNCKRLWIYWDGWQKPPTSYTLEKD